MTDIRKGGRGNVAPYKTVMVRTPEPLLDLAKQLTEGYRQVLGTHREETYLNGVQDAIAGNAGFELGNYSAQSEMEVTGQVRSLNEELEAVRANVSALEKKLAAIDGIIGTYRGQSKDTRDWTKAKQLMAELERVT
ncbi:hypothetical protein ACE1CD_26860 [Aerosakkonema sp. BLCC-F183]|uniref:hypothetical protein n=1 Tax=Aerosakkonema sp. BLCC-F183 TaxID=3342834 RepID=UPI0035B726DE